MKTTLYTLLAGALTTGLFMSTSTFASPQMGKAAESVSSRSAHQLTEVERLNVLAQDATGNKELQKLQNDIIALKINNNEVESQLYALRTLVAVGEQMNIQAATSAVACPAVEIVREVTRLIPSTYLQMPDARLLTAETQKEMNFLIQAASKVISQAQVYEQTQGCILKDNDMCCDDSGWQAACQASNGDDCHVNHGICSAGSDPC